MRRSGSGNLDARSPQVKPNRRINDKKNGDIVCENFVAAAIPGRGRLFRGKSRLPERSRK